MCRNVPKRCVVSGVLVSSVLFSYKVLDTEAPMLALPLRLPTAPYGGHMGHFLLSMLMLSGSAPFGNSAVKQLTSCYTRKLVLWTSLHVLC